MLGLFLRHWSIPHCTTLFEVLTKKFFRQRRSTDQTFFGSFRHALKCWLQDGRYNVSTLESCLKETFGPHSRMFDSVSNEITRAKVAVTASNISDASAYVFSNYNGLGQRAKECGRSHDRFIIGDRAKIFHCRLYPPSTPSR